MHIPITVSNKKIPKGTRIIKQKLTKKLTQKGKKKKKPITRLGEAKGRRLDVRQMVTGWVEGEGSLKVSRTERHRRAEASPTISSVVIGELGASRSAS